MNVLRNIKIPTFICILLLIQSSYILANTNNPCISGLTIVEDCDLCGCSTSSGSFGFGTLSNSNFVGLRYINQSFESRNGIFNDSPLSQETFNTVQLWAQIPVYKTFYVSATVPYLNLAREFQNSNESLSGIGDINIIGWYKYNIMKKSKQSTEYYTDQKEPSGHSLQFGLGVKLPTGEFEQRLADSVNPGFQVGTGSTDGIISLGYNYGGNEYGLNTLFTYYVKGENENEYQFGNQFSYAVNFYVPLINKEKINVMPFVGISGDIYDNIKQYDEVLADTDGRITNSSIGTEITFKKIIFGTNITFPISQELFGGNVEAKNKFLMYLNFAF